MAAQPSAAGARRSPTWPWVIVPLLLSALIFGAIAVAVRSSEDDGGDEVSGPAGRLPSVVAAADDLLGTVPAQADIATELGRAYGAVAVGFAGLAESGDDLAFAADFDRLPDAEARLLGRTLGEVQAELTPEDLDGPRGDGDRLGDLVFALTLSRAAVQVIDPDGTARDQALTMLPFSVQDLTGFDEVAATFASGDVDALATRIDQDLPEAHAAEVISSVANAISEDLPAVNDVDYGAEFLEAYNSATS